MAAFSEICQPRRPIRIRFGGSDDWHTAIRSRIDLLDFSPSYGSLAGIEPHAFDAVVPLSLVDYSHLRDVPEIAGKAILPSTEVVALCDDKLALDQALDEMGFGDLRPGAPRETDRARPFVAKARHGENGRATVIVRSGEDEERHAEFLSRPDVFRQALLADPIEYCAHFLMFGGRVRHQITIRHEMPAPYLVKGDFAWPRRSRPVVADPFADRFARLLAALGYEGSACIDYKIEAGAPKIMEINARMGGSLLRSINEYLDAYLAVLQLAPPRRRTASWLVSRRRVWARRLRRWTRTA